MSDSWLQRLPEEIKEMHNHEYVEMTIEEKLGIVQELNFKIEKLEHIIHSIESVIKETYEKKDNEISMMKIDLEQKIGSVNQIILKNSEKENQVNNELLELERNRTAAKSFLESEKIRYEKLVEPIKPLEKELEVRVNEYITMKNELGLVEQELRQKIYEVDKRGDTLVKRIAEHQEAINNLTEIRQKFERLLIINQDAIIRGTIIKLRPHELDLFKDIKNYLLKDNDLFVSTKKGELK